MKFRLFASTMLLGLLLGLSATAQDFSNKGKEFWLAYSYHVGMVNSGGFPTMTLYISSDVTTNFQVEIYGGPVIQSGGISPGSVQTVDIPTSYFIDAEGTFTGRTIHITGDKPMVVYSYITRNAASGATLCLPTSVLGKEYYSTNFTQVSNESNSNSFFTIVAVEDNTTVEITPTANTKGGWAAGSTHSVNLNKGQIYQVLGTTTGNNGVDLTGSHIKSVASGTGGCKRIAVFSGSGKIRITAGNCAASVNSSDNLYQQLYPIATWGKKYLTVPSYNRLTNIFRVIKSDPTANVYVNNTLIPAASFINNLYYEFSNTTPNDIESDKPISVAQYFTTAGCDGNPNPYDPDMIMLNPVEQNIDKVTLVSSNLVASPPQHHIHVIMRNGGTGISSFTLDGAPVAPSAWTVHPGDPNYSYVYLANVTQGYHRLSSDSGFNAIAYGYAPAESYGYSAGASVKDLYQFVSIQNQYATVNYAATCNNTPFYFSMTFPYQPTQIQWQFGGLFPDVTINNPVYESTTVVNGKQLYRYKLPTPYSLPTPGTYPIKVLAQNPTSDGCSGEQEINYDLQVYERPHAAFTYVSGGCVPENVQFTESANTNGRSSVQWFWDFGSGSFASTVRNPQHNYTTAGSYDVKYYTITDIGCVSDTVAHTLAFSDPPVAKFGISAPDCQGKAITFTDSSTVNGGTIAKWYWDFGDGSPVVTATTNAAQTHSYASQNTYTVKLKVETVAGCSSTQYSLPVTIHANPVPGFNFGNACLPTGALQFTNTSTINDGTGAQLTYQWDFADGGNASTASPVHNYSAVGPYDVKLVVTSPFGCKDSLTRSVNTIYPQPTAVPTLPADVCFGTTVNFTEASVAPNSTVTQWTWDFGDGSPTSNAQTPTHNYATSGTKTVKLTVTSAVGCVSPAVSTNINIDALPSALFQVSTPDCITKDVTLTSQSTPGTGALVKWTWNLDDGTTPVYTNGNPFTHVYNNTGTYHVSLIVENDKGCVSPAKVVDVTVSPLPVADFTLPDNCLNDPFSQFANTSTISDGSQSQFTYAWDFGDPNANGSNPNTSTVKNAQHRYTVAATYNVKLTVTSGAGCTSTITKPYTVNGAVPQSRFTINGGNSVCSNKTVTVADQSTVDVGRLVRLEIFWDDANDPTNKTTVNFPAAGGTYTHTYSEFYTPATKTYRIRVVAYSGDACSNTTTQDLTVKATPDVTFGTIPGVCADVPAFQVTQASVSNLTGTPVFSGTGISSTGLFNPATAGAGTYAIRYVFTGDNGCVNEKSQNITVFTTPTADAGPDRFVLEGGTAVLLGTGTGPGLSYLWSPSTYLNSPTIAQPVTTPHADITYTLRVTTSDGCQASDDVRVSFLKAPTIPNVFTPNGDGINDKWEIKYLDSYPGATVQIYNRYGQLVFSATGYTKPWDGTMNGKPMPAGTYYYIINPKNGRAQMSGFVDLVR